MLIAHHCGKGRKNERRGVAGIVLHPADCSSRIIAAVERLAAGLHGEARPDASVKNGGKRHIPHPYQLLMNNRPLLGNGRHYLRQGAADQLGVS